VNVTAKGIDMRHTTRITTVITLLALLGCASSSISWTDEAIIRPGTDLPDHFLVATELGASEPDTTGNCHSPMIDMRDDTPLILFRSDQGRGDYEVPNGRYGVGPEELLRLDCATGRPLGIVKQ